jgi:hypothetical protein
MMPFGAPQRAPPPKKAKGRFDAITSLYHDEFKWSLVKSITMFGVGIFLAREMKGVDFYPTS